ncbi:MAG: flavin reductase family protein [Oscillospiraceae bacterium]|nr:flavin reductase family protein [Oscillospiraceae bacterium]
MRKNFGAKPFLAPQPVLIVATYDESGNPNAMNAAWGGMCGADEIMIDLGAHLTTDNIAKTKAFTVSIASGKYAAACDYVGVVSGKDAPDKMQKAGFTVTKSEFVNAPVINELPIALECELIEVFPGGKHIGKIKNVSVCECALDDKGEIDLAKLDIIVVDPFYHGYYRLGEKVGDAFKSGFALK